MSISKSQAKALADGFLDGIGEDNEGLQPRETFTELFLLGGELIEDAQNNLNADNSNGSGKLSKSLTLNEPTKNGDIVKTDVMMNFYGQFVNSGVKGTKSGQGKYQFKSSFPSTKMVAALEKGISRAKKSSFNTSRSKSVSKNEIKNTSISAIDKAYGAGRNIKMYGIKATGFIDKAVKNASEKMSDRMGAALKVDIINSII